MRVGFDGGPVARARMAPASFSTTHSVFVPPPSNPKTHFIGKAYAKMRQVEWRDLGSFENAERIANSGFARTTIRMLGAN